MPPPPGEVAPMLGVTAIKPVERHGLEAIKYCCWDPSRRAIMGRTPKSWGLILLFYLIYYICLAGFWALMMFIFFTTIEEHAPKWTGSDGLIGTSPGLGLRPAQPDESIDSSMIIFNRDLALSTQYTHGYETWSDQIDEFLNRDYGHKLNTTRTCKVGENNTRNDKACRFDIAVLGQCSGREKPEDRHYGYDKGQPCLYFKLNRIYGVANEPYKENELPEDMPDRLKDHIKTQKNKDLVWVDCHGEDPADVEAMGRIEYFPQHRGFQSQYFPYLNRRPYESPVVAVKFHNPQVGQLLHIECRAWAKNIEYSRKHRRGMVRFELFILDNHTAKLYERSMKTGVSESYDEVKKRNNK